MRAVKGWNALSERCDLEKLALGEPARGRGAPPPAAPPPQQGPTHGAPTPPSALVSEITASEQGALQERVASAEGERAPSSQEQDAEQEGPTGHPGGKGGRTFHRLRLLLHPHLTAHPLSSLGRHLLCVLVCKWNSTPAHRWAYGLARSKTAAQDRCFIKVSVLASSLGKSSTKVTVR